VAQIVEDPHFIERELIADYPDEEMGAFPMNPVVPRLAGTPGAIRSPAPKLGEHNREIFLELGFSPKAYKEMLQQKVAYEGECALQKEEE
jgi:formyl-CoA transferase